MAYNYGNYGGAGGYNRGAQHTSPAPPMCPCGNCCVQMSQDQLGVSEKFGKFSGELQPGLNFLGLDCCGICITTRAMSSRVVENVTTCETKTKDNVFVRIDCAIQQQPKPDRIMDAIYKLKTPKDQIESYVADVVRAQVPLMKLDEVFANKDAIALAVGEKLTRAMEDFGFSILQSLVVNVDPDQNVKLSMNAIEAAKKNKTAAETKAEADKFVKIKAAEGERDSKALQGEGIAKQRAAIVQGLKDSIGADTSQMTPEAVSELLLITQYFDTLEKIAHSKANTVFVPQMDGNSAGAIRDGIMQGASM